MNAAFVVAMVTTTVRRSHAQVYDFPTLVSYTNYSACVQQQPGRTLSAAFEIWKVRRSQQESVVSSGDRLAGFMNWSFPPAES